MLKANTNIDELFATVRFKDTIPIFEFNHRLNYIGYDIDRNRLKVIIITIVVYDELALLIDRLLH